MDDNKVVNNFMKATKWSALTEVLTKVISPITNMILARIISPEAFGVVATITMVTSFAEMISDAGFQKYLVQHEFSCDKEKYFCSNVAFWTNMFISIIIWLIILTFNKYIACLIGNPDLGHVLVIASTQIFFTAVTSIQIALFRRNFDFRSIFKIRIITVLLPLVITLPLALHGFSFWALIIGNLCTGLVNASMLTYISSWKPSFYFNFFYLKKMFSFSFWTLIEALSIWLTTWIDIFIVSSFMNSYYLGLYKTSTSMVNQIMSLVTTSIIPVLFTVLSRLQNDENAFNKVFLKTQKLVSIIIFPLGIGIYVYSDLATRIILGANWQEAKSIIGLWALISSIVIILSHFNSELYRARGLPKLSFLSQLLHLAFLVPTCIYFSKIGFWIFIYARSLIRLQSILVDFLILKYIVKFNVVKTYTNLFPTFFSAVMMGIVSVFIKSMNSSTAWAILSIFISFFIYLMLLLLFSSIRSEVKDLLKNKITKSN